MNIENWTGADEGFISENIIVLVFYVCIQHWNKKYRPLISASTCTVNITLIKIMREYIIAEYLSECEFPNDK